MKTKEKFEILSLLFSKPNDFIKERIKDKTMEEMLSEAFPQLSFKEFNDQDFIDKLLEKIDKDYLYLFVGVSSPLASIYESSYYRAESRLMDYPARRNIRLMKKWGFILDESYKDLPDHLAASLSLIASLLELKEEAEEKTKKDLEKDILSIKNQMDWINEFREKILINEEGKFYSKIALAVGEALKEI